MALFLIQGIALVAATAMALAKNHNRDVSFCFNRKEAKSHGEGGNLIGAPLKGRVLVVDDEEHLAGIFTAKDLAYRVCAFGIISDARLLRVGSIRA